MSSCFLSTSGDGDSSTIPILDNSFTEEILPYVQSETPLAQPEAVSSCPFSRPTLLPENLTLWLILRTQLLPTLRSCINSDFGVQLKGVLNFGKQEEVCYNVHIGYCFWCVIWPINHTAFYVLATWILINSLPIWTAEVKISKCSYLN